MSAHRPGIEEGVRGGVDERETRAQPSPAPLFNSSLFASHTMEPVATLRLPDATRAALRRSVPIADLEPRTAPAYFAALLAERLHAELEIVEPEPTQLSLTAHLHR